MTWIHKAAEAATELATEVATQAPNPQDLYEVPSGFDLTAQIPKSTLMMQIISAVILVLVVIGSLILINRKHKVVGFSLMGGIALYVVFFYYAPNLVNFIFLIPGVKDLRDSVAFNIILVGVFSAVVGMLGRILCMRLYNRIGNTISGTLSVGIGVMGAMALYVALNCFFDFVNCYFIDGHGFEEAIWAGAMNAQSQEDVDRVAADLYSYVTNGASWYIYQLLEQLMMMVYHIAITVPLLAAYTDKESKGWYGYAMGSYALVLIARYLRVMKVTPGVVSILIMAAVVGFTSYIAWRMYRIYYKDEQRDPEEFTKQEPPKKKMPKFENLSNL